MTKTITMKNIVDEAGGAGGTAAGRALVEKNGLRHGREAGPAVRTQGEGVRQRKSSQPQGSRPFALSLANTVHVRDPKFKSRPCIVFNNLFRGETPPPPPSRDPSRELSNDQHRKRKGRLPPIVQADEIFCLSPAVPLYTVHLFFPGRGSWFCPDCLPRFLQNFLLLASPLLLPVESLLVFIQLVWGCITHTK